MLWEGLWEIKISWGVLSWLMLSLMASLSISGRKWEGACSGRKQVTPHSVDSVSGNENLVELWASNFKNLFTSSNPNSSHMLAQALADLEVPAEDLASLSFSAATVSTAWNKLKHGKAEGGCMTSIWPLDFCSSVFCGSACSCFHLSGRAWVHATCV